MTFLQAVEVNARKLLVVVPAVSRLAADVKEGDSLGYTSPVLSTTIVLERLASFPRLLAPSPLRQHDLFNE